MNQAKSWNDIITQIENSGLQKKQRLDFENLQRSRIIKQEAIFKVQQAKKNKQKQNNMKIMQRRHAQMIDKKDSDRQNQCMKLNKQNQLNAKIQNLMLIHDKNAIQLKDKQADKIFTLKQNPITKTLVVHENQRKKKLYQENKLYDQQNLQIIKAKKKAFQDLRQVQYRQGNAFKNYVEQTFKKIDQERHKFKNLCLNNRKQTVPVPVDSLEKQYSSYLQQQIADKNKEQRKQAIFKYRVNDKIYNNQIIKINSNPQIQTASPAYLGRIPYNYDRQKQLSYVNKIFSNHARNKTQVSSNNDGLPKRKIYIKTQCDELPEKKTQMNKQQKQVKLKETSLLQKNSCINTNNKIYEKQYKQFNILTGSYLKMQLPKHNY